MLQAIRDRATGWIAWVIIILICIPFALWGINEFASPERELVVARVNDSEISYYRYRNAVQRQRERLRQALGGAVPPELLQDERLRERALDALITDEVLVQASLANGLRVGDAQLAAAIQSQPVFQSGGRFSQSLYEGFLRSRGSTAQSFELDLRRALLNEQLANAVQRTALVTDGDLERALTVRNEERRFQSLRVDPDSMPVLDPAEEAVREWFEAHPDMYEKPERVQLRYVEISRDDIANAVTAEDAELQALYEQEKENYRKPEQREARHILITVARDADEAAVAAARERIEALRERIAAGEDFAEVAKEASEDPGSASLGGGLGYFGRGVMDPAFEEAAFAAAEGGLSEPVRSRFGWHLIEVTAVQPQQVRSFEDARADVLRQYQQRQADLVFAEQVERLANLAFEHPESLDVVADTLATEVKSSDFFSRGGEGATGIAARANVRAAAFSGDVLAGNNSELLELGSSRVVVVRVAEREPARPHTLDEVRDEIVALLRSDAAAAAATATGERILSALRAGTSLEDAAAEEGVRWGAERTVTRARGGVPQRELQETLFEMPAPGDGGPSFAGTSLADGSYVVLALLEVGQAELSAEEAEETRQQLARSLEAGYGDQAMGALLKGLRERSEVQILEQNLSTESN
jgi:peptidyl-prolyl cis-trans isomerase D